MTKPLIKAEKPAAVAAQQSSAVPALLAQTPIFILHWNRPEECIRTVQAFRKQAPSAPLYVVDNRSEPAELGLLEAQLPADVTLIRLDENRGWGGAFNAVLRQWLDGGNGQFCFIAAHDALPEEDCLELLLDAMSKNARIGIACPEYGISEIPRFSRIRYYRTTPVAPRPRGTAEPVEIPYGTLLAFRRDCLNEIGLFDERYFAYGDEHEIGLRARRNNWEVSVVWGAIVVNPGTWTASRTRSYLFARNSLLLIRDYAGWGWAALRLLLLLPNTLRMLIMRPQGGYAFSAPARLQAIRDFLLGRFGAPPK